ncbi:MAG TPA: hypothetical protein VLW44_00450 [Streptosporangiaceae bacterium]|nr:hypothetical protein [Streptosporangiaceae bacterium]
MPVVLLVMAAAILVGVVLAALGRVGEMATFASDTAPIELGEVSATDVALLRPPMSLWGYNVQATEDALRMIARSLTARDVEIATLRRELAGLRADSGGTRAGSGSVPAGSGSVPAGSGGTRATRAGDRPAVPAQPPSPSRPADPGPSRPADPSPSRPADPSPPRPAGQASPAPGSPLPDLGHDD